MAEHTRRIGTPLHDATQPERDWGTEPPPDVDVSMGQAGHAAGGRAPAGASVNVGGRLLDATELDDDDPRVTLSEPYPKPVVTATERTADGAKVLDVRCPHCGRTHVHGRRALPAYIYGGCGGAYTISGVTDAT